MRRLLLALALLAGPAFGQALQSESRMSGIVPKTRGGWGIDVSGSSGIPKFSIGTLSFITLSGSTSDCLLGDGTFGSCAGAAVGGVSSVNSATGAVTLSLGTSGSDLAWSGATLNVPDAGESARGVVTNAAQTLGGVKTFEAGVHLGICTPTDSPFSISLCGGDRRFKLKVDASSGAGGPYWTNTVSYVLWSADHARIEPNVDGAYVTTGNISDITGLTESQIDSSSETGTGTKLATATAAGTSGNCVQWTAGGDVGDAGAACAGAVAAGNGISVSGSTVSVTQAMLIAIRPQARLTLTSGTPVTVTDVTAALVVYYTPYNGSILPLYYLTDAKWYPYTLAEKSLNITDSAQTGTMTSGNKIISGLTDTSQLMRGMGITGTSVGAASVIATIDSATQVTGTVNSTGSTTNAVTFKVPASTLVDLYAVPTSTTAFRVQGTTWTSSGAGTSARATALGTQDGVYVNGAAIATGDSNAIASGAGRFLGTVMTTATAGQAEDSNLNRLVGNQDNTEPRGVLIAPGYSDNNGATSYATTSTTFTAANGGTNATAGIVNPSVIRASAWGISAHASKNDVNPCLIGLGENTTTTAHYAQQIQQATAGGSYTGSSNAVTNVTQAVGYNTITMVIAVAAAGTCTYYADLGRYGGSHDPHTTVITAIVFQ